MKLGTSQRGTGVPSLVAFLVLTGVGVALAGMPEPAGPPEPSPSVSPSLPGRSDHGEIPGATPSTSADPGTAEACTTALEAGTDALERRHGLDRAIEVIIQHCGKSPQATGLLTALGRLEANRARQEAKQERQDPGRRGGQPNEHANGAATNDQGSSDQAAGETHGSGATADANPGERGVPATHP
jgi:hypothetical protein